MAGASHGVTFAKAHADYLRHCTYIHLLLLQLSADTTSSELVREMNVICREYAKLTLTCAVHRLFLQGMCAAINWLLLANDDHPSRREEVPG